MPYKNKEDRKTYEKEYYRKNKEDRRTYGKEYYRKNKEDRKTYWKEYRRKNLESIKKYCIENRENKKVYDRKNYQNNKEKITEREKKWRENNPEKVREIDKNWVRNNLEKVRIKNRNWVRNHRDRVNNYKKNKYKTDLRYNLINKMRNLMRHSLKGNKAGRHWENLVDYTLKDLIKRLKRTMPKGYTWQDFIEGKLQIDHIIPISVFNFTKPEHIDFRRCWTLDNLQLLPANENLIKRNKLNKSFQPALKI